MVLPDGIFAGGGVVGWFGIECPRINFFFIRQRRLSKVSRNSYYWRIAASFPGRLLSLDHTSRSAARFQIQTQDGDFKG
jgi:hypothetical protein